MTFAAAVLNAYELDSLYVCVDELSSVGVHGARVSISFTISTSTSISPGEFIINDHSSTRTVTLLECQLGNITLRIGLDVLIFA